MSDARHDTAAEARLEDGNAEGPHAGRHRGTASAQENAQVVEAPHGRHRRPSGPPAMEV
ncbi:hypothetical protein [Actinacidiphila glaucinigra]|uniref:hypothetical protein n=1 Tax=Actinacidiphila glaucinigra TaxID=235986 RepID=UPI0029AE996F|nr:hypothetical protein [Streptomyces sp. PA03-3a]